MSTRRALSCFLPFVRRVRTGVLVLLFVYLMVELFSAAAHWLMVKERFSFAKSELERGNVIAEASNPNDRGFIKNGSFLPWKVSLLPYFGFGEPNGLDFLEDSTLALADPNEVVVAITGGSVATRLYFQAAKVLEEEISLSGKFKSRRVRIILLAQGSWKQPQQLMAVAYYLVMGGKIDILVSLDGHNEIAMAQETAHSGTYFAYPHLWQDLTATLIPPEEARWIGESSLYRSVRVFLARNFALARWSVTAQVIWKSLDRILVGRIGQVAQRMSEAARKNRAALPFSRSGPKPRKSLSPLELRQASVFLWKRGALQLHRLAKANGAEYFSFLQPSQYNVGSKPFSQEERRVAVSPLGSPVTGAYPLLETAGRQLASAGVNFQSLNSVFREIHEPLYVDTCCHVNERGSELMARAIGKKILSALSVSKSPRSRLP